MSYHASVTSLIQALMLPNGSTYDDLKFITQMSDTTVRSWIKAWRDAKLVHISGWSPDPRGYPTIQRFAWSPGMPDAPCPAMSSAERVKAWKARQKEKVEA